MLHDTAHAWFQSEGRSAWATCPLTQNGVLRIVGHRQYPGIQGGPSAVAPLLADMFQLAGHEFWPDDISLLESSRVGTSRLLTPAQVADSYLLALAVAHHGRLATMDAHLVPDPVHGGPVALHLIRSRA